MSKEMVGQWSAEISDEIAATVRIDLEDRGQGCFVSGARTTPFVILMARLSDFDVAGAGECNVEHFDHFRDDAP
jgi:hypothetical protein